MRKACGSRPAATSRLRVADQTSSAPRPPATDDGRGEEPGPADAAATAAHAPGRRRPALRGRSRHRRRARGQRSRSRGAPRRGEGAGGAAPGRGRATGSGSAPATAGPARASRRARRALVDLADSGAAVERAGAALLDHDDHDDRTPGRRRARRTRTRRCPACRSPAPVPVLPATERPSGKPGEGAAAPCRRAGRHPVRARRAVRARTSGRTGAVPVTVGAISRTGPPPAGTNAWRRSAAGSSPPLAIVAYTPPAAAASPAVSPWPIARLVASPPRNRNAVDAVLDPVAGQAGRRGVDLRVALRARRSRSSFCDSQRCCLNARSAIRPGLLRRAGRSPVRTAEAERAPPSTGWGRRRSARSVAAVGEPGVEGELVEDGVAGLHERRAQAQRPEVRAASKLVCPVARAPTPGQA